MCRIKFHWYAETDTGNERREERWRGKMIQDRRETGRKRDAEKVRHNAKERQEKKRDTERKRVTGKKRGIQKKQRHIEKEGRRRTQSPRFEFPWRSKNIHRAKDTLATGSHWIGPLPPTKGFLLETYRHGRAEKRATLQRLDTRIQAPVTSQFNCSPVDTEGCETGGCSHEKRSMRFIEGAVPHRTCLFYGFIFIYEYIRNVARANMLLTSPRGNKVVSVTRVAARQPSVTPDPRSRSRISPGSHPLHARRAAVSAAETFPFYWKPETSIATRRTTRFGGIRIGWRASTRDATLWPVGHHLHAWPTRLSSCREHPAVRATFYVRP